MPTPDAIDAALRDPNRFAPGVRRLGGGSLAVTTEGGLWRVVGGAAAVYALKRPTGRILALRVPLDDRAANDPRAAERWRALANDPSLGPLRGEAGALPAELRYMPDALTLEGPGFRSTGHPWVAMEFLPGGSVALAAQQAAATGDRPRLARLARTSTRLFLDLERVGFDHGRLRPASILLRGDGSPALVGLKTALWPGAPGAPRAGQSASRDRLPALALLTELLALADDPGRTAGARSAPDRLLLSERDLRDPAASALLADWRAAGDPLLATAAALLGEALLRGTAPAFSDAVAAIEAAGRNGPTGDERRRRTAPPTGDDPPPHAASSFPVGGFSAPSASAWGITPAAPTPPPIPGRSAGPGGWTEERPLPTAPAPVSRQIDPHHERRLAAARRAAALGDIARLLQLWNDGGLSTYEPAADLRATIDRARSAEAAWAALRSALAAEDAQRVATVWSTAREAPGASLVAARVDALLTGAVASRARLAVRRQDAAGMVNAVRLSQELGIALEPETRRAARRAAMAGGRRDRLTQAIEAGEASVIVEAAAMVAADEPIETGSATARAVLRARALVALERAVQSDDDLAILAAGATDPDAAGTIPRSETRDRLEQARARAGWIARTRAAIRARDGAALGALLTNAPDGAIEQLRPTERRRIGRLTRPNDRSRSA
jgi:hypothetical protein